MAVTKLSLYQEVARLLADARFSLITDDVETRYALDDAWESAVLFVLRQAAWRFALKTAALVATTGPLPGFAQVYSRPADYLRTHAIFQINATGVTGRECPLDLREQGLKISANKIAQVDVQIRYVSVDFADPALALNPWPEHFAQTVAAYLAFLVAERVTGERGAAARMSQLFSSLLPEAVAIDAVPENRWLAAQNDGSYLRALLETLTAGYWRFAMKTAVLVPTTGPLPGFAQVYAQPTDWLKTHAIFQINATGATGRECPLDIREQDLKISANKIAAVDVQIRYVSSTLGLNATLWPDLFDDAVLSRIRYGRDGAPPAGAEDGTKVAAALWQQALGDALRSASEPENRWWRAQNDGSYLSALLDTLTAGHWRFALKTATLVATTGPLHGFAQVYSRPADWLRTHAIFQINATGVTGRECPLDIREQELKISTNKIAAVDVQIRYVSSALGLNATLWPDAFADAVLARIGYGRDGAQPAEGEGGAKVAAALWQKALGNALSSGSEPENRWHRAQNDGSYLRALLDTLTAGYWRFALKTAALVTTTGPLPGFAQVYTRPSDCLRTHAIFQADTTGSECPLDLREQDLKISANKIATPDVQMRYVSSTLGLNATLWPDLFAQAVLARIVYDRDDQPGEDGAKVAAVLWQRALDDALAATSEPENIWLAAQNGGSYLAALLDTLTAGYWRFAMKTDEFMVEPIETQSGTPAAGFPYRYARPAGWLKTHSAFVAYEGRECPIDLREDAGSNGLGQWSTAEQSFAVRYVSSTLGLNAILWPDLFAKAVLARIAHGRDPAPQADGKAGIRQAAALWQQALGDALDAASEPENRWWRFQRDGRWLDAVHYTLERGRWRFAIDTVDIAADVEDNADGTLTGTVVETPLGPGTISPGYSAHFTKPNDWLRTIWLYRADGTAGGWYGEREDVDYRDEGGAFHANFTPLELRYLKRSGLESWRWPTLFRDTVLAWLEYGEARGDPTRTAVAAAKLKFFDDALETATDKDDAKEQPRVTGPGRFVRARGRGGARTAQGWW